MSRDVEDFVDCVLENSEGLVQGLGDTSITVSRNEDHAVDGPLLEGRLPRRVKCLTVGAYLASIAEVLGIGEHTVCEAIVFRIGGIDTEL